MTATREDRQNILRVPYKNPNEYFLFPVDRKALNKPFLICPVCKRKVTTLFTLANDANKANDKFAINDCACGYDAAKLIADENMVIRTQNP